MRPAALAVVGFLAAGSIARSATRSSATVSLRKTTLGMVLVAAKGHTLYLFPKAQDDRSASTANGAQFWPPRPCSAERKPTADPASKPALLETTKHSNGSLQVTHNKHPLYTYTLDRQAGQTKGEGLSAFGAKWYTLSASAHARFVHSHVGLFCGSRVGLVRPQFIRVVLDAACSVNLSGQRAGAASDPASVLARQCCRSAAHRDPRDACTAKTTRSMRRGSAGQRLPARRMPCRAAGNGARRCSCC
jgi:predicted lipoprotein with Yx(FWY)xxD motif